MAEDERIWDVKRLLFEYVKSPSLRHLRDPHSIHKLARDIVKAIDRGNSIWTKWDGQREVVAKAAVPCWIPVEDLRDFLNRLPGPQLTTTDVEQRLRAFEEEDHFFELPNEELQAGCLALYEQEKTQGTELPAIIGLLRDHIEREEERIRVEREEYLRQLREQEQVAGEQRLLSGADCKWTQLRKSKHWYCRKNGRTYRLSPTQDKMWHLFRVKTVSDEDDGDLLGKYQRRGDATKVVSEMAYQPEPRW
ncbi:hypothetical protein AAFN88_17740 [Pelagibius sp. CAU 1746]|uniref:hypothetical protein n=1 Tax=Pelagibius sp. CAU 1746 TaxID=3140370 RepID=UPI00325BA0EA